MIQGSIRRPPPRRTDPITVPAPAATFELPFAEAGSERFTFFWRGPFSQWHPSRFEIDGIVYSHAEQWMMAEKARLFDDQGTLRLILASGNPKDQKALGRKVRGFDETRWNAAAKGVVKEGCRAKFTQDPKLLESLLATEGTTLVEASPYDRIWGIGLSADDPRAQSRSTWQGRNWLGEVLTELRNELAPERLPRMA